MVAVNRSYDGPAIDSTWQYITERPALDDDSETENTDAAETIYATEPEPAGEASVENVPVPGSNASEEPPEPPSTPGQTTLTDWGGESS